MVVQDSLATELTQEVSTVATKFNGDTLTSQNYGYGKFHMTFLC